MKILIVNSCGKSKAVSDSAQPTCKDLATKESRAAQITKFHHLLHPAGTLYTGGQATNVWRAVQELRKQHEVDYYIISAGFGVVRDDELLPPYECTFSGKSKAEILSMATELNIKESLSQIAAKYYDYVFLILGKDYLIPLDNLSIFQNAGTVVHFSRSTLKFPANCYQYNEKILQDLPKSIRSKLFSYPIGGLSQAKGAVLLNYSHALLKTNISFQQWWQQLLVDAENSSISEPVEADTYPLISYKEFKKMTTEITQFIKQNLTKTLEQQFLVVQQHSQGLRGVNNKKNESRLEYYKKFEDHVDAFVPVVEWVDKLIPSVQTKFSLNKKDARQAIINVIQEIQITQGGEKYRINSPKFGFMQTLVDFKKHPEKLQETSVYRPRQTKNIKSQLELDMHLIGEYSRGELTSFELINPNKVPVQNVVIQYIMNNKIVDIYNASGKYLTISNNTIVIPVIFASMSSIPFSYIFEVKFPSHIDIADISANIEFDDPKASGTVKKSFTFA